MEARNIADNFEEYVAITNDANAAALLVVAEAILQHVEVTRLLAYGPTEYPTGFEALVMAIAGEGGGTSLASALQSIAEVLLQIDGTLNSD